MCIFSNVYVCFVVWLRILVILRLNGNVLWFMNFFFFRIKESLKIFKVNVICLKNENLCIILSK